MRLFIAINFSEPSRRALFEARERLRGLTGGRGGFTQDTNLHLTLAFLGEVEQERAKAAEKAMRAAQGRSFTLCVDLAGRFAREGGDIWWAGSSSAPALAAYQRRLVRELTQRGFELEKRRFYPHITLARRVPNVLPPDTRLLESPVIERVEAASLMRSELGRGAPKYTELARVEFDAGT